ncbi:MAG: methyltransferase domain-containing protein [Leptolyngbyaceae cyanobacterium CRU_2_3]|nr:methyltransferase domain-containing protein [Leptolyngbyaceae cyanobacterium CRU_2_3]
MMKFCKVADITDWHCPNFQTTGALLSLPGRNRKIWEYIQVYNGLNHLGLLNGKTHALGLGVGTEPLIYAFTNVCQKVVATDLYNSQNWSTASLPTDAVYQANCFPYERDRLIVQHMDMTHVEYPDESFDFIWSCCSIEHVGTFEELHRVYQEIHRVLKPGGIAALTTEYNPTDRPSYEPNMLFTDQDWIEKWLTGNQPLIQGFELLDWPDFNVAIAPENQPQPKRHQGDAIPFYSGDIVLNSIALFLRKNGEFSQAYNGDWLPASLRLYLEGCQQQRQGDFLASESTLKVLLQDSLLVPRLKIAAYRRLIVALKAQKKVEEIVDYCQQVFPLCREAEDPNHLTDLAHYFKGAGLWEESKSLYERVQILPGSGVNQVIRSFLGQAEYFAHQNNFQLALNFAEQAIHLDDFPTSRVVAQAYLSRGTYQQKLGNFSGAMADFRLAIAVAAPHSSVHEKCQTRLSKCQQILQDRALSQQNAQPIHFGKLQAMGKHIKNFFQR